MKSVLFAGLLAAALAAPAIAHEPLTTETKGPYIGFGVAAVEHAWNDNHKARLKLFGGYNVNDRWGVEFGLRARSHNEYAFGIPDAGYHDTENTSGRTMYLAGKFTAPISAKLSVQSKLGVSHNKAKIHLLRHRSGEEYAGSVSQNGLYASLGLKYQLAAKVAMTLELEHNGKQTYSHDKPQTVSLNASYSF